VVIPTTCRGPGGRVQLLRRMAANTASGGAYQDRRTALLRWNDNVPLEGVAEMDVLDEGRRPRRRALPLPDGQAPAAGPAARITLIGGFTLRSGSWRPGPGGAELPPGVQRLVVRLCLSGRPARTAVAGDLWPEVPEEQAHASLRSALWRLRKTVPGLVETVGGTLALSPEVRVDVQELQDWAERVTDPRSGPEEVAVPDAGLHGELLPGWYDDWVLLERERLRQLRLHALETLAARLADAGRFGAALQAAYLAVRADPLRESAHRTLVRVHLAEGNLVEAHRAYEFFRRLLHDELGVLPSEQMDRLVPHDGRPGPACRCACVASVPHPRPHAHPLRSVPAPGRPAPRSVTPGRGTTPVVVPAPRPAAQPAG
jgi:DNA-binding SARP family transcriptional activator